MKAIFLVLVLIGAPFLIPTVNVSPYDGTCPKIYGGSINHTVGFSCIGYSWNATVSHFDPWFSITQQQPLIGECSTVHECYMKGLQADSVSHTGSSAGLTTYLITNRTLLHSFYSGFAIGYSTGD